MKRKIKINGKNFYVIPKRQIYSASQSCTYTLCVAADPWGSCLWNENSTPQKLLDITDNRNPESMTYCWFCSLPDKIQASMLPVNLWTDKLAEMFIPSVEEWRCVLEETRASIIPDTQASFTRFFASNRAKKNKLICNVYCLTPTGEFMLDSRSAFHSCIIPAFYISSGIMGLFSKKDFVCEKCGKTFQKRINLNGNLCDDCWNQEANEKRALEESIKGYVDYASDVFFKSYSSDEMRQIIDHRDAILDKFQHDSGISRVEQISEPI